MCTTQSTPQLLSQPFRPAPERQIGLGDAGEVAGRRHVRAIVKPAVGRHVEALLPAHAGPVGRRSGERLFVVVEEEIRRRHRAARLLLAAQPADLLQVATVVQPPAQPPPLVGDGEVDAHPALEAEAGHVLHFVQRLVTDDRVHPEPDRAPGAELDLPLEGLERFRGPPRGPQTVDRDLQPPETRVASNAPASRR